jgi:hypothetical protein
MEKVEEKSGKINVAFETLSVRLFGSYGYPTPLVHSPFASRPDEDLLIPS